MKEITMSDSMTPSIRPSSVEKPSPTDTDHLAHHPSGHSTGVGDHGRWSTRRLAVYALLTALAMALSLVSIPIFPAAPFLKYDPSGIVALVAGLVYGPAAGTTVGVLGVVPHVFTNPVGALIDVLVTLALVLPPSFVARRHTSRAAVGGSLVLGGLLAVLVALGLNLLITPLYAKMTVSQVAAMILPVLLPFNLLKFSLDTVSAFLLYRPVGVRLPR
jgi:riboflavin transporter FmnP